MLILSLSDGCMEFEMLKKVKFPRAVIPNTITALNMFFGYFAIAYAFAGKYESAVWVIYLATYLDLLDGRLARSLHASTKFGIEMDSFADLVTFGVAPSILMYRVYFHEWEFVGIAISFLPALFSAFRLARFNVEWGRTEKSYMKGVPTPASALFLVGFVAFAESIWGEYRYPGVAMFLVISISLLMVSNLKFDSNSVSRSRSSSWKLIPFFLSIISVIAYGAGALFVWASLYVLIGLTRWVIAHLPHEDAIEASA